jgi:hypothetical protein
MATINDLVSAGFVSSVVEARRLNIEHSDPEGLGPFCRLRVATTAPETSGVYAWVVDAEVFYVGKASHLLHVVEGTRLQRAYNDYTYVPPSKVAQTSSPRVRVNGLLNGVIAGGHIVTWWWMETRTVANATCLEAQLIHSWNPRWNLVRPKLC